MNETLLTKKILDALLKILPNRHFRHSDVIGNLYDFPNFGKFFQKSLTNGQDSVLLKLKHISSIIENLPKRHKLILLASLEQFNSSTTQRLIGLSKSYQGKSNKNITITYDFIYIPEHMIS
jgi:hypothetical protein